MIPQAETGAALHQAAAQAVPVSSLKLNHHQAALGPPAVHVVDRGHRIDETETAIVVRFRLLNVIAAVLDPPMKIR
ncbi:hypothetical protein QUF84_20645 [Fictibacillus enclensis]|uniref:hypothetical protein n=1 Tax=Fictibacillus enclensis TaxID=1017270 RepID=UPI0025A15624|nr:hypothetical protein [Fictibacillus enclensis]MDM5339611.1 hypothetical protein [Fictibacillus enclensis]